MPTSQISINYGYGYTFRTGGGTPAPPLVAGANPPAQYAASGTTTLTFAFPAATGGTGPIVYAPPALTAPPGSTASVSGTAPGNITINNAANGEGYLIRVYATDADGQQVLNDAIGAVEDAAPSSLVPGANPPEQYVAAGTSSISFTFNAASGGVAPLSYGAPVLIAPPGSTASVSGTAPGVVTINNAADEEAYLVRVYVTDGSGQQVLNDALASVAPAPLVPLAPIIDPARQALGSSATGASVTFTQPGAPPGMIYMITIVNVTTGALVVPTSGTNLGPYSFTVSAGNDYIAVLVGVAPDGQNSQGVAQVAVAAVPALAIGAPTPVALATGSTTGTITWPAATGGVGPYTYEAIITSDSTGLFVAFISGQVGTAVSLGNLSNGQTLQLEMNVTDANGDVASSSGFVLVASAAAGTMTPGAFPATQLLASTATSTSIAFAPVGGVFTAPVTYVASVVSGPGSASNVGTAVPLTSLIPSGVTLVRLRATDSSGVPQVADAFALVEVQDSAASPLVWQKLAGIDFRSQGTVNFVLGSNAVSLTYDDGRTVSTSFDVSMAAGAYATCPDGLSAAGGWKRTWAATATGTFIRSRVGLPIGVTLGADDDVLIVITGKFNNAVSANSVYWQVSSGSDLSEDATNVQGMRLLRSGVNTALFLRASGNSGTIISQTSSPPCPLDWQDGSTVITESIFFPRRSSRGVVYMSEAGMPGPRADLGQIGTTPASNSVRPNLWGGKSTVYVQHYGSNGAANGLGAQYQEMHTVSIYRRTLP